MFSMMQLLMFRSLPYFHSNKLTGITCYYHIYYSDVTWGSLRFNSPTTRLIMMTSSNGNIFRVTGPLCGEFTGPAEFPTQRPVTRSFDVFFDLRLNKRLSKQPWGWWFETPSWSLWRQCNVFRTRTGQQQRKHQSSTLLDFARGIH